MLLTRSGKISARDWSKRRRIAVSPIWGTDASWTLVDVLRLLDLEAFDPGRSAPGRRISGIYGP